MLIRSQDKKLQTSYETGMWQADRNKIFWLSLNNGDYFMEFGIYSTEAKAIKVLDMIQNSYEYIMTEKQYYIFQMPQDSEVKE